MLLQLTGKVQLTIHRSFFYFTISSCLHAFFFLSFLATGYTINYTIIWQENIAELEEQVRGSNENHTTFI